MQVRWTQTSTEVLVWVTVPSGTRAREVVVDVSPARLCLKLGWWGRVVDGPLARRIKVSSQWYGGRLKTECVK